ncbi:MAG: integrase core domain-containing protein [Cypionkella sp.]
MRTAEQGGVNHGFRTGSLGAGKGKVLADARRKLALWCYDYNTVRPHSSLRNKTPAQTRRALERSEGSAPGALLQHETDGYQTQELLF